MSFHDNASRGPSATTVAIQCLFPQSLLCLTKADSQLNVASHYGQVYNSQKVCASGPMFIETFSLF